MKKGKCFEWSSAIKTLILVVFIFWGTAVCAQPTIEWQKSLGGSSNDCATSVQQTKDGGYIVAGYSYSNNGDVTGHKGFTSSSDYWIVKLNSLGVIEWQRSLGGSQNDVAYSIQQTKDGGYIVAGYSNSNDSDVLGHYGRSDYWIVKLDSLGVIEWQESLGGSQDDVAYSIRQTTDGGYIIAGSSYSNDFDVTGHHGNMDSWIVKLDSTGLMEWQKSLGGSSNDCATSIQQTKDGGYIVAGYSYSNDGDVTGNHGGYDYWIVKLDSLGVIKWQKSLGGSLNDVAYSIQQTKDGGYIIAGVSNSDDGNVTGNHGYDDSWIVKLDSSGTLIWQKSFGGSSNDCATSIQQTKDGGYIVAGYHGITDYWIVKLDSSGFIEWQESFGGNSSNNSSSIQQTTDGGYIVAGNRGTMDYWIVKLVPCANFIDSLNNYVTLDTFNTSTLISIDTLILVNVDTVSNHIITKTDSVFHSNHLNTTTIIRDSMAFMVNQCTNVKDSTIYADTVSTSMTVLDTVRYESSDTISCPTFKYNQVTLDSTYESHLDFIDTLVTVQIDTIGKKVIITTDSMFVSHYLNTTTFIKDSTVFTVSQCDSSVHSSKLYSDTTFKLIVVSDTVIHQSFDTTLLSSVGKDLLPSNIKVYPNPFTNQINIEVGNEPVYVTLYDPSGQIVYQATGIGHLTLEPHVLSGVYFLRIVTQFKVVTIKLISDN